MTATFDPADPDRLLAHDRRIRGLARRLVGDGHRAEDVAQQTWCTALRHGLPAQGLSAWLCTLVRNFARNLRRDEARRLRREQAAARPEGDCLAQAQETERMRRAVVAAVFALAEPYRTTLALRFLDALPPRQVARRMHVPVETVRTRVKRGLELLRQTLDREHLGERSAWCTALLPLTRRSRPPLAAAALLAGTLAVAALGLVALWPEAAPSMAQGGGFETVAAPTLLAHEASRTADQEHAARERAFPPARTGSLLLRLCYAREGTQAAGVTLRLARGDGMQALLDHQDLVADAEGLVRVADLEPGTWRIGLDRGGATTVGIEAGKVCERVLEVPAGLQVAGVVVDADGRFVPGAELVFSECDFWSLPTLPVGRTDACGRFELRDVPETELLGARHPDHGPSALVQVHGLERDARGRLHAQLVLGRGSARVRGVVRGPDGRPVAGAALQLGRDGQHALAGTGVTGRYAPAPLRTSTDATGCFGFAAAPLGKQPLYVVAPPLAPARLDLDLRAGGPTELCLDLVAGVELTVAVPGAALVCVWDEVLPWPYQGGSMADATTGEGLRFFPLAPGRLRVQAESFGAGRATREIHAQTGERLRWDGRLELGRVLQGRVQDAEGAPVAGLGLRIGVRPHEYLETATGLHGEFRATNCAEEVTVEVLGIGPSLPAPGVERLRVRPDAGECVVTWR